MNRAKAIYRTVTKNEVEYVIFEGKENTRKEGKKVMWGDVPIDVLEVRLRKELKNTRATITSVRTFDINVKHEYESFVENGEVLSIKERS